MKQGRTLSQLAQELERQLETKRDFVADTRKIQMSEDASRMELSKVGEFPLKDLAHGQVADRLQIPKRFYDRMRTSHPDLVAHTVNSLFQREPETRMVRTLDGDVRAFLSDRFNPIDNYALAERVLPKFQGLDLDIRSCEVTETRMYLKAVYPGLEETVRVKGFYDAGTQDKVETYQPGIVISNSEVGLGSVYVGPGVHTVQCTNLATFKDDALRRYHIGRQHKSEDEIWAYLSDETREKDMEAFFSKIADMVEACLQGELFRKLVEKFKQGNERDIQADNPVDVVEVAAGKFGLIQPEKEGIMAQLARGGNFTQLGLSQAVTRYSQAVDLSYDRATELEDIGGQILDLPKSEWEVISIGKAA